MQKVCEPTFLDNNVMFWCKNRLDSDFVSRIIRSNPHGLSNEDAINTALRMRDYIVVLTGVWTERDKAKRLEFLHREDLKFHPILSYELGMAEFAANPSMDTIRRVKALFSFCLLRNILDAQCSMDPTIKVSINIMHYTYDEALSRLVEKRLGHVPGISVDDKIAVLMELNLLLEELEEELLKEHSRFLSPAWIKSCGAEGFSELIGDDRMKPEAEWDQIRLARVQAERANIQKQLEGLLLSGR